MKNIILNTQIIIGLLMVFVSEISLISLVWLVWGTIPALITAVLVALVYGLSTYIVNKDAKDKPSFNMFIYKGLGVLIITRDLGHMKTNLSDNAEIGAGAWSGVLMIPNGFFDGKTSKEAENLLRHELIHILQYRIPFLNYLSILFKSISVVTESYAYYGSVFGMGPKVSIGTIVREIEKTLALYNGGKELSKRQQRISRTIALRCRRKGVTPTPKIVEEIRIANEIREFTKSQEQIILDALPF